MTESESLIGLREAMQTSQLYEKGYTMSDFRLPPTCHLVVAETVPFIENILPHHPTMIIELQNSRSGPSAAHTNKMLVDIGRSHNVASQIAQHTMLTVEDARFGFKIGPRLHLFGNASDNGGTRKRSVEELISRLEAIASNAPRDKQVDIRASLEQATETGIGDVIKFIQGIRRINEKYGRRIISGLGIPDTNGRATPEQYNRIIRGSADEILKAGVNTFAHIHDDQHHAFENIQMIHELSEEFGFPITTELIHPTFSGERNGTRPNFDEANKLGIFVPQEAYSLVEGSSWRQGDPKTIFEREELAMSLDGSGVHATSKLCYGDGRERHATGGLTGIMGKGHFIALLEGLWQFTPEKYAYPDLLKDIAQLGREYALQHGNLEHRWAIAFARLAIEHPEVVKNYAQDVIGSPETWLDNPIPDLKGLLPYLVFDKI